MKFIERKKFVQYVNLTKQTIINQKKNKFHINSNPTDNYNLLFDDQFQIAFVTSIVKYGSTVDCSLNFQSLWYNFVRPHHYELNSLYDRCECVKKHIYNLTLIFFFFFFTSGFGFFFFFFTITERKLKTIKHNNVASGCLFFPSFISSY